MKQLTIEMPVVSKCAATKCSYNVHENCHAKAITVGDVHDPNCDTFFQFKKHAKETRRIAGVGACKVQDCRHNEDFECTENAIKVGLVSNQVKCLNYAKRE